MSSDRPLPYIAFASRDCDLIAFHRCTTADEATAWCARALVAYRALAAQLAVGTLVLGESPCGLAEGIRAELGWQWVGGGWKRVEPPALRVSFVDEGLEDPLDEISVSPLRT